MTSGANGSSNAGGAGAEPAGADDSGGAGRSIAVRGAGAATGNGAVVLGMIDRLLDRPDVSVEKLEQLFALHQKVQADAARRSYDECFPAMTAELPEIDKKGKIIIKEKGTERVIQTTPYALWDDTNRLIKPILSKHGFGLSFRIAQTDAKLTTTAVLSHVSGHREETSFSSSIDSTGSKNNVQGWGSAFSYGKRYTGTAILNITTRGEDDDGKAASSFETLTDEQADTLRTLITTTGSNVSQFLAFAKAESISDILQKDFTRLKETLEVKAKRQVAR